ncbi:hypothetical protein A3F28_04185 [Candidatus Uhrbacteria bacterium RIFCSPHIGHO2_12_FULL_57_11]|uniref:Aspartate--tRNA ligase n=1 Tax=Candidatus Uhrbacteria bacterium RIFCSPHIGHO2_12_FULL_57_11 TaxID=1802398 RepID=A0A1F7ULG9_9BACT|nr:MAG: hypothetical protein A3F28_04185 [Candidatus Uhrbacteria bacterium RIFCSPHIGHO2_12_FULL_57_11]
MQRTWISETIGKIGQEAVLFGWVNGRRDMGKLVFIDLRDRSGIVQVVFPPGNPGLSKVAGDLRPEFVVSVRGKVNARPPKQVNPNLPTGTVEVEALEAVILNQAKTPPFEIDKDTAGVSEETRLAYRYLDLRSERMRKNLELRHRMIKFFRDWLSERGFLEIETPMLTKGTPEGAREFIVPSRLHPGKFYVLPQSPQQFKQLLMVAGVERYFQIARALRDEDQRGDRQPEHTQLDMEMSFVDQNDVLELVEEMMMAMVKAVAPEKKINAIPFPRIPYDQAMKKYKSDKPDLRRNPGDPDELAFAWIVDFPMFEKGDDGKINAMHHPFTSVHEEDLLDSDPLRVHAKQYDLVLNGYELASGSIRIHRRDLQNKVFKVLGLSDEEIERRFGHMLRAFEYGAPPHGGIAPGIDRLAMLLAGEPNIREVIAFPKTGDARDLLMGAPSEVSASQLREVHIQIIKDKKGNPSTCLPDRQARLRAGKRGN